MTTSAAPSHDSQVRRQRRKERRVQRQAARRKRGIVLLVVVSLLTLFIMIGITYVLVASQYQEAARQQVLAETYGDDSEGELEAALGQLLFGSVLPRSPIAPHNMLADLYGNDQVNGIITAPVTTQNSGQTVYMTVNMTPLNNQIPNYYAGRVLTFIDGNAAGISVRVMAYYPYGVALGGTPEIAVEAPESDLPVVVLPDAGNSFVINGAPFNGTGAGFDQTNVPNPLDLQVPIDLDSDGTASNAYMAAYLPNYPAYRAGLGPTPHANFSAVTSPIFATRGGLDEGFDTPDYQTMFLAMVPPGKLAQNDAFPLLPSFHRPDLVRYWQQYLSGTLLGGVTNAQQAFRFPYGFDNLPNTGDEPAGLTPAQADELVALKRMCILRPLREDNPNFTGSNPGFFEDNLAGPYDVDNDGDGISDSIWVDLGLPIVTSPNGRRYKRLVAIMVKDLDGRVNLNVHGNMELATNANARTAAPLTDAFAGIDPTAPTPIYIPRGLGFGPAETDFLHILGNDLGAYQYLMLTRTGSYYDTVPPNQAGLPGVDDQLNALKTLGIPQNHTMQQSAYSTPPDVWGRAAMALDYYGQPVWFLAGTGERIDDPYEVQYNSRRANADAPYTVAEMEALLRYHDPGTQNIPSRLLAPVLAPWLASESRGTPGPSQVRRESFTAISSDIPAPRLTIPREMRGTLGPGNPIGNLTLLDLYTFNILQGMSLGSVPPVGDPNLAIFTARFQTIVPFEIYKGQRFNLNRLLGNGVQDPSGPDPNAVGTVDDPSEAFLPEQVATAAGLVNLDFLNDTPGFNTPDQRQMYARHLYCLMMLLRNRSGGTADYDLNNDGTPTAPETARYFAQWAINVVDFRDADSIMTPFEYDTNPFDGDGWAVDGNISTQGDAQTYGGVVWGCERPELLITETLAGHDRRTTDTNRDPTNQRVSDPVNMDDDYDSELRPQGYFFVELYNPWVDRTNNLYDHKPAELYNGNGLDLSRVTPADGAGNSWPVWRMLIVRGNSKNVNPDIPYPERLTATINGNLPPQSGGQYDVERSVYFANLAAPGVVRPSTAGYTDGEVYFPSGTVPRAPLAPGSYAVVGSSGTYDGGAGTYTTYLSRRTDAPSANTVPDFYDPTLLNLPMTRRIILNPGAGTFRVVDNRNNAGDDFNPADILPVVTLPVDTVLRTGGVPTPQSLTITEPTEAEGLYPAFGAFPPGANDEGHYSPAIDAPLDSTRSAEWSFLMNDGTLTNFRAVHLQRLANPLLPWNPVTNPYMTVDTSSADVTPYNGVTLDTDDPQQMGGNLNFQTFQRGGRFSPTTEGVLGYPDQPAARATRELWRQEPLTPGPSANSPAEGATGPHHMPLELKHTLGYLNQRYQPSFTAAAGAYRGAPYHQNVTGNITSAFPFFAFNNRPFTSNMELLQVPAWPSSMVLERFTVRSPTAAWPNVYDPNNPAAPYGHLLNFFQTTLTPTTNNAPELARILEFLEVPSPYVGTERMYNVGPFLSPAFAPPGYRPPYNTLSRFRDPGRININTIFEAYVWNSAVRGFPGMCTFPSPEGDGTGAFLSDLSLSRQQPAPGGTLLTHDATYPSLLANPFRPATAADLMPSIPAGLRQVSPDATLLRRNPRFAADGNKPMFASQSQNPYEESDRNPYFRYQANQKVGQVFTTNSNCFAVWITVGYFEVEPNDADNNANTAGFVDAAHPDGTRLAQEMGSDSGEVKRHRAFYIIDRSIPVGYQPGYRHNTDKAVLLRRYIE